MPKAFITLRDGFEPSEELALSIFRHIHTVLAPYKRVRRLEISSLPKTVSGKIRRVALKKQEEELRASGKRAPGEYFEEDFAKDLK